LAPKACGPMSRFDDATSLALRRAIFYQASEIYSSAPSGLYDFGPHGQAIRRNIAAFWRRQLVQRNQMLEIQGAQIMPKAVFESSGHLTGFSDPLTQCQKCHAMHRADKIVSDATGLQVPEGTQEAKLDELIAQEGLACPSCGGQLSKVRRFNLMMGVMLGPLQDQVCYLRPETCQSIFCGYLRLTKTMRVKPPFGIAQEGASFRNEISPRNFLIRQREFGQIECEIFFDPEMIDESPGIEKVEDISMRFLTLGSDEPVELSTSELVEKDLVSGKLIAYYLAEVQRVWEAMGFPHESLRFREVGKEERPFYSKETWDFEALSDKLGWVELVANNYRMDYDLAGHQKGSGADLRWTRENGEKFIPHVWEISAGLDRTLMCLLEVSLRKEGERTYLSLQPQIAPFIAGVFPLVNKGGLPEIAHRIVEDLRANGLASSYDESGSIGRRYARVDEIGCPYSLTVDFDSLKDTAVTIRDRDTTKQVRVEIAQLPVVLWRLLNGVATFNDLKPAAGPSAGQSP